MSDAKTFRYAEVACSQCGRGFGPGDHGYSHCEDHAPNLPYNHGWLPTPTAIPAQEAASCIHWWYRPGCVSCGLYYAKPKDSEPAQEAQISPAQEAEVDFNSGKPHFTHTPKAPEPIQPSVDLPPIPEKWKAAYSEATEMSKPRYWQGQYMGATERNGLAARVIEELGAALARAEKAEAEMLSLASSFGLPHDDDPFAAKLVVSGTFDLSPNGIKQRQRDHEGTIGDWIRRAKESESSRNKWHMICRDMGWPAETTAAAAFIDAIRFSQQENTELKAELTTLRQQLKDSEQERPIETQIATMKEIERLSFNRGVEAAAKWVTDQVEYGEEVAERMIRALKEPKQK